MQTNDKNELYSWYGEHILEWYFKIERDLPWRKNHDPYRIWVSEIMLQQTQVKTVIPYFERFVTHFPTVEALAHAPEEEVLKCWEGLGYYSRARNLQAGAKMVVENFNGVIPNDVDKVSSIKGVGPYTTGAIMSIAFNEPIPAVDGNVMRVLSRFLCLEDDVAKVSTRKNIEKIARAMIPDKQARYFNQALMELGALVCTPKSPSCQECPVVEKCEAHQRGLEKVLPYKTKAKAARVEYRVGILLKKQTENGPALFIRQRPSEGLLASMWELPHIKVEGKSEAIFSKESLDEQEGLITPLLEQLYHEHHILARPTGWYADIEHVFSHIHWKMRFYEADLGEAELPVANVADKLDDLVAETNKLYEAYKNSSSKREPINGLFMSKDELSKYPFPNVFLRMMEQYLLKENS